MSRSLESNANLLQSMALGKMTGEQKQHLLLNFYNSKYGDIPSNGLHDVSCFFFFFSKISP